MGRTSVIASGMSITPGLTFDRLDKVYKRTDVTGCVFNFKGWGNNFAKRPHNSNHTFTFLKHRYTAFINLSLLKIIAMDKYQFYSLPIQSTVV